MMDEGTTIVVFDPNITTTSPAGSCLLNMLRGLEGGFALHLFTWRTDLADSNRVRRTKLMLPAGPVFLQAFLFTIFSTLSYQLSAKSEGSFLISTQGGYPFCDLSYAHCCHALFLSRYRSFVGGSPLRRGARLLTHLWGALTERIAFRHAKTIVVPSEGLARELASCYPGLVAGKIQVLPNPVDSERFARPEKYSNAPLTSEFVFCFCALGNFEWKGLRLILEALASLDDLTAKLIVIGGQPGEVSDYSDLARRLGVGQRVDFVGLQKDIRPYLWASDAFVFPSVYETFPLVCLQAAAAGLPLITTPLYGVEEFLEDGLTGWIVERQPSAIAGAMREATESREKTRLMGLAAQRRVQSYNEQAFRKRWIDLLAEKVA